MASLQKLLIAALFAIAAQASALDLTPFPGTRELEGSRIPIYRFNDGQRVVTFQPHGNWRLKGEKDRLQITLPDFPEADLRFILQSRQSAPPLDGGKKCLEWLTSTFLPANVETAGGWTAKGKDMFAVGPISLTEFTLSFNRADTPVAIDVLAADINDTQRLIIQFTCRPANLNKLREHVAASLSSWDWEQ